MQLLLYSPGSTISKFVASNFVSLFRHMKSYKQKNYEQALIETYLKFDELLRLDKVNLFLHNNSVNRKDSRLDINFSYGLQPEFGGKFTSTNYDDVMKTEEAKEKEKENQMVNPSMISEKSNGSGDKSSSKESSKKRENIIDLREGKSLSSKTSSVNSESKSRSQEILTLDQHKMEINLKKAEEHCPSYNNEGLIAKDMGTTANILVIKNNYLYLANVGDSLAVLFKNGVAIRLNQEHKTTLPSEFTRISKSGSRIINNRIEGRLNLTRALGIFKI